MNRICVAGVRLQVPRAILQCHAQRCQSTKAWVPKQSEELELAVANSMIHKLSREHAKIIDEIVPWYLHNFPAPYFHEVGSATRLEHLKGLMAIRGIGGNQEILLSLTSPSKNNNFQDFTVMGTNSKPGSLHRMFLTMRHEERSDSLRAVKAFTAFDRSLTLNIFTYFRDAEGTASATLEDGQAIIESDLAKGPDAELFTLEALKKFFPLCSPGFIRSLSPERFVVLRRLYEQVRGTDNVGVHAMPGPENAAWISIAAPNAIPKDLLAKLTGVLARRGLDIVRMYHDHLEDPSNYVGTKTGEISLIRFLVAPGKAADLPKGVLPFSGSPEDVSTEPWTAILNELRCVRWMDEATLDLVQNCPELDMMKAEILSAFCALLHGPLNKCNSFGCSRTTLLGMIKKPAYTRFASEIADLFIARFDPKGPITGEEFKARALSLRKRIEMLTDEAARTFLEKMVDATELTLRTNLFFPNRYGLALRVDPSLMVSAEQPLPFGVFFVHGENFDGFHNRFQNIARGGLRLVTSLSLEQFSIESARCYDEVYGLSSAQEMKNKDIPEGGSKAVVLVDTTRSAQTNRDHIMRTSVKAFTNSLLDLSVPTQETQQYIVDYLGFEELIYLGPDEQVIPEDINWIIQQAEKRGYPIPAAFMSSKPLAGINHKEYGVTSEGVVVCIDVALRNLGIQPDKQPFTVKITGGPDGDVAGNLMRILFRDYGKNARIVGVADGSGCAEDKAGLPEDELMRLFHASLPIAELDPSKLSADGVVHRIDTEEGVRMRNSMHNRVKADVFVPAGGRPNTIHAGNWANFLDPESGEPSSPLIVEGANIFITPEARQQLFDKAGVRIVKDSSANKCGVITSSFEICASMLLEESEFLSIKEELVQDVLLRLRQLARLEAELMFREFNNYPGALPHFSTRISSSINGAYAGIRQKLVNLQRGDELYEELLPLFLEEHLPRKLAVVAGDRVSERIPIDYLRNAFGKILASKLLYNEGINFLEAQPADRLFDLALRYVKEEKGIKSLISSVSQSSNMSDEDKSEVARLLQSGGVRSRLGVY